MLDTVGEGKMSGGGGDTPGDLAGIQSSVSNSAPPLQGRSPHGVDGQCPDDMAYYDFGITATKRDYKSLQRSEFTAAGQQRCLMQHKKTGAIFSVPMTLKRSDDKAHLTEMSKQVSAAYKGFRIHGDVLGSIGTAQKNFSQLEALGHMIVSQAQAGAASLNSAALGLGGTGTQPPAAPSGGPSGGSRPQPCADGSFVAASGGTMVPAVKKLNGAQAEPPPASQSDGTPSVRRKRMRSMGSNSFEEGDEEEDKQGEVEAFREKERKRLRKQFSHLDDDDVAQEVERRWQALTRARKKQCVSENGEGSRSGHTTGSASQSPPRAPEGSMGSNSFKEVDEEEDKQGDGAVTATRATSRKRCKSSEASTSSGLSAYELQRQANVDKNRAKLVAFGIESPSAKPPAKKAKSSSPKSKASPPPPPPIIPADPAAWMNKPGVDWNKDACELFGQRIKMKNPKTKQMEKAVIKAWQPFEATDQFAVVFDSMPDKVFKENLLRKGSRGRDWQLDTWEGDVEETAELRPICTQCGMALGMGRAAWTLCPGGCMEPGAMSTQMLPRLRSGDPNRRPHVDYKEADIDSD